MKAPDFEQSPFTESLLPGSDGQRQREDMISAEENEILLRWLAELSRKVPFDIKTTAAPHYRRVLIQQGVRKVTGGKNGMRATQAVNDGKGFLFVSHDGDVYPSGFLPVSCGNVRKDSLASIYRTHPVFQGLRDPDRLQGKCGLCEYRQICGGSRARTYAVTGDLYASDPSCFWQPGRWKEESLV